MFCPTLGAEQCQLVCYACWICFTQKPCPISHQSWGICSVLLSACFLSKLSPEATGFGLTVLQFYFWNWKWGIRVLVKEKVGLASTVIMNDAHKFLPFCLWYFCYSIWEPKVKKEMNKASQFRSLPDRDWQICVYQGVFLSSNFIPEIMHYVLK